MDINGVGSTSGYRAVTKTMADDINGASPSVTIPPGTEHDHRVIVPGHGMTVAGRGARGSLEVKVALHVPEVDPLTTKSLRSLFGLNCSAWTDTKLRCGMFREEDIGRAFLVLALVLVPNLSVAQSDPDYPAYLTPPDEMKHPEPPPPGVPTHVWKVPLYPSPEIAPWKREEPNLDRRRQCNELLVSRQKWMARFKYLLYQNTQARGGHLWHQEIDRIEKVVHRQYYYMETEFRAHTILGNLEECQRMDHEIEQFVNGILWQTLHERLD